MGYAADWPWTLLLARGTPVDLPVVGPLDSISEEAITDLSSVERGRLAHIRVSLLCWSMSARHAIEQAEANLEAEERSGDIDRELLAYVGLGVILSDLGHASAALGALKDWQATGMYSSDQRHLSMFFGDYTRTLSLLEGHGDQLETLLAETDQMPPAFLWVQAPPLSLARSRLERRRGGDPLPAIRAGLEHARQRDSAIHELALLRELVLLGSAAEVADRMRAIAALDQAPLAALMAQEAEATAVADPVALTVVSQHADRYGATLIAAESAAVAHLLFVEKGRSLEALAAEVRSDQLFQQLPGQISIPKEKMKPILSGRERQVLDELLVGGTSKEIAERMFISPRTVDSHLRRIYQRLDVHGREELVAALT